MSSEPTTMASWVMIAGVALVVVLGAIVFASFYFLGGKDKEE